MQRALSVVMGCVLAVAAPALAWATPEEAASCASRLSPPARLIYDATASEVHPGQTDLHDAIKTHTRDLVMQGKVERAVAKPSAIEAGACLRELAE
jgi:hypothetical protein